MDLAPIVPRSTGVRRLDDLLGGGLPQGAILLYGPPYTGKEILERRFLTAGLQDGGSAHYLLTETGASEASRELRALDPIVATAEKSHRITYFDMYTHEIGEVDDHPCAVYLDEPVNLEGILPALGAVLPAGPGPGGVRHAMQSLSSLILERGFPPVFRFLRTLIGRLQRHQATVLLVLEEGMHSEAEVQAIKHLCRGVMLTKTESDHQFLRVEGLPAAYHPGWVEYEFDEHRFELTGSFSAERIRGTAMGT